MTLDHLRRRSLWLTTIALLGIATWGDPPAAAQQGSRSACLHDGGEIANERERRLEALSAVRLINNAAERYAATPLQRRYPTWDELSVQAEALGRMDGGTLGRLARKIDWASAFLLPGWRIHYVSDQQGYAFSLQDVLDRCGFTYFSDSRNVVAEGYPLRQEVEVVPLGTR